MLRHRWMPCAAAIALAGMAVASAVSGNLQVGAPFNAGSGLALETWTLTHGEDGHHEIAAVTVGGVPQSVVGKNITVYLGGVPSGTSTITAAGTVRVQFPEPVDVDEVGEASVLVSG